VRVEPVLVVEELVALVDGLRVDVLGLRVLPEQLDDALVADDEGALPP
jgi:hypothetical protein